MTNEMFIIYLVIVIIAFMFMIYFGLTFTNSIKDKNVLYILGNLYSLFISIN